MNLPSIALASVMVLSLISCGSSDKQGGEEVTFVDHEADKRVDVMIGDQLFTAFCWPDDVAKPFLYPILTSEGTPVTRGFPLHPRAGERTDHPHQVGMWLNYGNVNSYDFWGNSYAIPEAIRKVHDGSIKHLKIEQMSPGKGSATMVTDESWLDPFGKELLQEKTEYHFIVSDDSTRFIDRITTLKATQDPVLFKDTKEGFFGIRVARQLELPTPDAATYTDAAGNPTTVKQTSNQDVHGNYRNSEGVTGEAVWGKRAKWMDLYSNVGNEKISLVICDHADNLSYPTYWHARPYGLFATNPFGVKDFTEGKDSLNYTIAAGDSLTFKFRVIIGSGRHLSDSEINAYAAAFNKQIGRAHV